MNNPIRVIVSALALLALCGAAPGVKQARQKRSEHRKSRALIVGVNKYAHPLVPPTSGAEEDALAAKKLIKHNYDFDESEIHMLLGQQATAANIVNEFRRWLIEGTQPGDRVFFHYSGHGSRVKDLDRDESDGYDEVIAPYDVAPRGKDFVNIITDDEIGQLIAQLSGRLAVMIFDSCHSGTISRGPSGARTAADSSPRYLPSPEELARLQSSKGSRGPGGQGALTDYQVQDGKSGSRDLKLVDEKTIGPATGIVVISAAQSEQVAWSMKAGDGPRGALSYAFGEAHQGRVLTLRKLREEVTGHINALHQSGRLKGSQQPEFEIISTSPLDDKPLFADAQTVPAVALANPQSTVKLSLRTQENKTVYRFGETISYHFTTDTPGYLYLIVFSEKDVATCIFPNANLGDNRLEAGGHVITRDGREGFYVGEPEGKDVVIALLSATKLDFGGEREEYSWGEVFKLLSNRRFSEHVRTRGQTSQKPAELTNWQAVSLVLEAVR